MELSGTRIIAASREEVWKHLNDPETLRAVIPGCEALEALEDGGFEATVRQKIGPVRATFRGKVTLADVRAPESYRINGEGSGGIAGFAKGGADVRLNEVEGGTELSFAAEAQLGGKLAQLGNRLVGGVARKVIDEFFDAFMAHVETAQHKAEGEA